MAHLIYLPALVAIYAASDRATGGGLPALDAKLPGRLLVYGAAFAALVGFLAFGWTGIAAAALWAGYRSLPFGTNELTPVTADDTRRAAIRHAVVAVPLVPLAFAGGHLNAAVNVGAAVFYVVAATLLARWYGKANADAKAAGVPIGDQNAWVEALRGAAYGLAVSAALST